MHENIEAIYEDGVFKPLQKPHLKEHEKVELTVSTGSEIDSAVKNALSITEIGESSFSDTSLNHDEYLYGKKRLHKP